MGGTDGNARSPYPLLPLVPSPALGPALSQCCIRALGGARTRSASPSSPFWRREPPPPSGLLSALLFVARPSAGGSAARVRCGPRPRGPSGRGGTASFPPRLPRGQRRRLGVWAARPLNGWGWGAGEWSNGLEDWARGLSRLNFLLQRWELKRTVAWGHTLSRCFGSFLRGKRLVSCIEEMSRSGPCVFHVAF